jgi:hypothetical protein
MNRRALVFLVPSVLAACGGASSGLSLHEDASTDDDGAVVQRLPDGGAAPRGADGASDATAAALDAPSSTTAPDGSAADAALADATAPTTTSDASADGAVVAPPLDAGAPDAAGQVACGAAFCDIKAGQFCCVQPNGAATCESTNAACAARRDCEKTSDCSVGNVCCYDFSSFPASASCRGDCSGGGGTRVQACRATTECATGTCAVHACRDAGSIESCEAHAPECP